MGKVQSISIIRVLIITLVFAACERKAEENQIKDLIRINRETEPFKEEIILGFKFGDNPEEVKKRILLLNRQGKLHPLINDSIINMEEEYSLYQFYFLFDSVEGLEDLKWVFVPGFDRNKLVSVTLKTHSMLDGDFAFDGYEFGKGIWRNIIKGSHDFFENAEIVYRLVKEELISQNGTPEFVTEDGKTVYWFQGNCIINVNNSPTGVTIIFKDSLSE